MFTRIIEKHGKIQAKVQVQTEDALKKFAQEATEAGYAVDVDQLVEEAVIEGIAKARRDLDRLMQGDHESGRRRRRKLQAESSEA